MDICYIFTSHNLVFCIFNFHRRRGRGRRKQKENEDKQALGKKAQCRQASETAAGRTQASYRAGAVEGQASSPLGIP